MHEQALYINGIFSTVFDEILAAHKSYPRRHYYLQPHSGYPVAYLKDHPPSHDDPVRLYASASEDLQHVQYTAEIIRWEDKRLIPDDKRARIVDELKQHQPGEVEMFDLGNHEDDIGINLLYVMRVQKLGIPFPVGRLTLIGENRPLRARGMPGGLAYVYPEPVRT